MLWATGDLVGLLFFGTMFFQWQRAESRAAVRVDRKLDREERRAAVAARAVDPALALPSDDVGEVRLPDDDAARAAAPVLDKPWWEVDAGPLAERFRRESRSRGD